jgi:hypothetical protein
LRFLADACFLDLPVQGFQNKSRLSQQLVQAGRGVALKKALRKIERYNLTIEVSAE